MIHIGTTRFNNTTFAENQLYRYKEGIDGCIYGLPVAMPRQVARGAMIFVIEMNIQSRQIMGIGYVPNFRYSDKVYPIYESRGYNRYIYKGRRRIARENIQDKESIYILENVLFKGKGHMCRGQGITRLNQEKLKDNKKRIMEFLKTLFEL